MIQWHKFWWENKAKDKLEEADVRIWILFSCPFEVLSSVNVWVCHCVSLIFSRVYRKRIRGFLKTDSDVGKNEYKRKAADSSNQHLAKPRLAVFIFFCTHTYTDVYTYSRYIQCVPLATEPGISLIILTPMKILHEYVRCVRNEKECVCSVCL